MTAVHLNTRLASGSMRPHELAKAQRRRIGSISREQNVLNFARPQQRVVDRDVVGGDLVGQRADAAA